MKELRIKDMCEKGSSNLKQKDVEGKDGLYPVYGASGIISHIDTYHQEKSYIAVVKDGSGIGRVSFMPAKSSVIGTMQYILPKEGFDINYIGYCLQSLDLSKYKQGAAIPHIYFRDYGERIVKVSEDLKEQQSIVNYLDSAFAKIDAMKTNAEKALNEAKALFQASLKKMLEPKEGWEEKTLKEICRVINGRAYSKDEMLKKGKYRILRVGNFFTNDSWYYSDLELEEDKYCDNGDLLYAWSASFGPRIWDGEKVIYHYHIWKMVCSKEIDKYFLCYWLDSDELKKQTMTNLHGATMAHITKGIIEAAHVSFPPLPEQQSIVDTLESLKSKVDRLQENFNKISQECDALKQSLLRQVFSQE